MKQEVPLTWALWISVLTVAGAGVWQLLNQPPVVGWTFLGLAIVLIVCVGSMQAHHPR